MTLAVLIDFLTINLEENSEQLRHKLTAAETEKKRMAAEMGKLNTENEANLGRLEELKKRIVADAQAHAQERGKLQKRFDADYAVFLGRKGEFNESLRLRCVFCPQENQVPLTSFLFHVAREHMFDQARGMTNCSSKIILMYFNQCFGSGSAFKKAARIRIRMDRCGSESGLLLRV